MAIKTGNKLADEILDALGINKKRVINVTLDCRPGDLAVLTVKYAIDDDGKIAEILTGYRLEEAPT